MAFNKDGLFLGLMKSGRWSLQRIFNPYLPIFSGFSNSEESFDADDIKSSGPFIYNINANNQGCWANGIAVNTKT